MGATVFNIPVQINDMIRYTEYITNVTKSELYRKAISYFIENNMDVTDQILYMPLSSKPYKEQVYIDSCKNELTRYRENLQDKCAENIFPFTKGPGIMQKKNRYRNSTVILQAIINYLVFLYDEQESNNEIISKGLKYIKDEKLEWKKSRS